MLSFSPKRLEPSRQDHAKVLTAESSGYRQLSSLRDNYMSECHVAKINECRASGELQAPSSTALNRLLNDGYAFHELVCTVTAQYELKG